MLQSFSDGIRNSKWLAYVIIGLIIIPFAFWGINSYLGGGGEDYVAVVNGNEISMRALDREYNEQRNRLQQAFGGKLPANFAEGGVLKRQALESLINNELLKQAVAEQNLRLGDEQLAQRILTEEAFLKDGRFDKETYESQLRSIGYSTAQFEASVRQSEAQGQIRQGLIGSAFVLPSEQKLIESLQQQRREFASIRLELANYSSKVAVSEAEIQEYFDANKNRYMYPEKVKLEYIELSVKQLLPEVSVTEDQVRALYDEERRREGIRNRFEERTASHILLRLANDSSDEELAKKSAELEAIKKQVEAGESFAELAKQHSEDPGSAEQGGDLGAVSRGVMVKPFEDALFALQKEGELSGVVRSEFGLHLIQLTGLKVKPFEAVSAQLERELKQKKIEETIFFDKSELLANASYENPDSLAPAANATGLKVEVSDWIERGSNRGLGRYAPVRGAAFSDEVLQERRNSSVLELGPNHQMVVHLKEHQPAAPKPLAEVSDEIKKLLADRKAREELLAAAERVKAALVKGEAAESVAKAENGEYAAPVWVGRNQTEQEPLLLRELFKMAKPVEGKASYASVQLSAGDQAVLILSGVEAGKADEADKPAEDSAAKARSLGMGEYQAWMEMLKSKAEIVRRDDLL